MPLLVLALPALAPGEGIEWMILAGSTLLAAWSLRVSIPLHRNKLVLVPIALAVALWSLNELRLLPDLGHHAWTVAGSLLMAGGLFWSARLRHRVACAACKS